MKTVIKLILIVVVLIILVFNLAAGEDLDKFAFTAASSPAASPVVVKGQFNGYTNYWHSVYWKWLQYGNLYLASQPDVERSIAQNKVDIAEELGNYDGLKIQDMPTEEEWIRFVKDRGGYIFRPVYSPDCDKYAYDGVIGIDGNQKQVDAGDVPFILQTGLIKDEAPSSMVLFAAKGRRLTRQEMWKAILDRRAVGILPQGRMMGPALLRHALQMLLLDRVYLENLFADRVQLDASWESYELRVRLANLGDSPVTGTLEVRPAPEFAVDGRQTEVTLPPGTERAFSFAIKPSAAAKANPVLVEMR